MSIAAAERPLQKPIAPENHPLVSAFREIKAPVQTSRPPRAARTIKQPMAVQGKIGNTELAEIQVCCSCLNRAVAVLRCFKSVAESICPTSGKMDAD